MLTFRCSSCGAFTEIPEKRRGTHAACRRCRAPLDLAGSPQRVGARSFAEAVHECPSVLVVDFARRVAGDAEEAAALKRLAESQPGEAVFLELDAVEEPQPAADARVDRLPTRIAFSDRGEVARVEGAHTEPELQRWLTGATAGSHHDPSGA